MPCEQMPAMIVVSKETAKLLEKTVSTAAIVVDEKKTFRKNLVRCYSATQLGAALAPLFAWIDRLAESLQDIDNHAKEIKREKTRSKACKCSHTRSSRKKSKKGRHKT